MMKARNLGLLFACVALLVAAGMALGPAGTPGRQAGIDAAPPLGESRIEIRWQDGAIVLHGAVPDEQTRRLLVEGATARLGGEADQVFDWLVTDAQAAPVSDADALAQLIRLGLEGWRLQWHPRGVWLAVQNPADARSAEARALAQRAFGSVSPVRLQPLP